MFVVVSDLKCHHFLQLLWHLRVRGGRTCSSLAPNRAQTAAKSALLKREKRLWNQVKLNVKAINLPSTPWRTTWVAPAEGGGKRAWAAESLTAVGRVGSFSRAKPWCVRLQAVVDAEKTGGEAVETRANRQSGGFGPGRA